MGQNLILLTTKSGMVICVHPDLLKEMQGVMSAKMKPRSKQKTWLATSFMLLFSNIQNGRLCWWCENHRSRWYLVRQGKSKKIWYYPYHPQWPKVLITSSVTQPPIPTSAIHKHKHKRSGSMRSWSPITIATSWLSLLIFWPGSLYKLLYSYTYPRRRKTHWINLSQMLSHLWLLIPPPLSDEVVLVIVIKWHDCQVSVSLQKTWSSVSYGICQHHIKRILIDLNSAPSIIQQWLLQFLQIPISQLSTTMTTIHDFSTQKSHLIGKVRC